MKKLLLFFALFPLLLSGQEVINLDPSSTGSINILLGDVWGGELFVSKDNNTGIETGTLLYPYNTIQEGLTAAAEGQVVIVLQPEDNSSYSEHLTMATDSVRLMTLVGQNVAVELQSSSSTGLLITGDAVIVGGGSGMGFTFTANAGRMIELAANEADVEISYNIIVVDGGGTIGVNVGAAGALRLKVKHNKFMVSSEQGGFFAAKNLRDAEISNNEFVGQDQASSYAIQMSGFLNGIVFANYIHADTSAGWRGFASGIFPHTATSDPHASDSLHIFKNIVQDCGNGIRLGHSTQTADMKALFIYDNIIQHCVDGIEVANDAQVYPATYDIYMNTLADNTNNINNAHATIVNKNANTMDDQLLIGDGTGSASTPALGFGDGNTGFYEFPDNQLNLSIAGGAKWQWSGTAFRSTTAGGPNLVNTASTSTEPNMNPSNDDLNTGVTHVDDDSLGLVSGGVLGLQVAEGGGKIWTTLIDTTIIEEALIPDADDGADIGIPSKRINLIYADSVHAAWFGGSDFELGESGSNITVDADSIKGAPIWDGSFTSDDLQLQPQSSVGYSEGLLYYDSDDKTLVVYNDEGDVSLNVGEELYKRVRNNTGVLISDGTPVYISGAVGQLPTIAKTDADAAATALFAGLSTHGIEDNSNGYITTYGIVRGLDTDGSPYSETWADGDQIYISSTAGELTNVRPTGAYVVCVGNVDYAHTSQGRLQVHPIINWAKDYKLVDSLIYENSAVIDNDETDTLRLTETVVKIDGDLFVTGSQLFQHSSGTTTMTTGGTQTIGTGGTYEKLFEGGMAYTGGHLEDFTESNGRLTYTGTPTIHFKVDVWASIEGDEVAQLIQIRIAEGGSTIAISEMQSDFAIQDNDAFIGTGAVVELATNEYIEVFGTSDTNDDEFTIHNLIMIISQL